MPRNKRYNPGTFAVICGRADSLSWTSRKPSRERSQGTELAQRLIFTADSAFHYHNDSSPQ